MVSRFGGYSSIRSHFSMLPARRIGVTVQVNGPGASLATDIVAALVYDLEAGRTDARTKASARLDSMVARLPLARRAAALDDSVRQARQQRPLRRPMADFTGSYSADGYGVVQFIQRGDALRFRWGVLEGPVEIYNPDTDQLRIEVAGSPNVVVFRFGEGSGQARGITLSGIDFARQ